MPINIRNEQLLSLSDASRALPPIDGKRPHVSTLWRWCKRGIRGVRLEYVRLGHRICTSQEALGRFAQRLADEDQTTAKVFPLASRARRHQRTDSTRARGIRRAQTDLEAAGI